MRVQGPQSGAKCRRKYTRYRDKICVFSDQMLVATENDNSGDDIERIATLTECVFEDCQMTTMGRVEGSTEDQDVVCANFA